MKTIVKNIIKNFSISNLNLNNPRPNTVNIEATNICNLSCKMCRRGKRAEGFIDLPLLLDFLPEAKKMGVKQIGLHTVGESILHPEIGKIIALCKKYDFYTYLDINGNTLTTDKAKALVDNGLDSVKFSIDAADDETYKKIRCGGRFSKVYQNIKKLKQIRDLNDSSLRIYALFIIMAENIHQKETFKTKMEHIVDEIQYTVINNNALRISENSYEESRIDLLRVENEKKLCPNLWSRIVLSWQGEITMCCTDFNLDMSIGKYKKGNLSSLWSGSVAQGYRNAMLERKTDELPIICKNCDNLSFDVAKRTKLINEIYR